MKPSPSTVFEQEHVRVRRLLEFLHKTVERLHSGDGVRSDELNEILELVHQYVDRYHHAREDSLFDVLQALGAESKGVPLARLGQEHDRLRSMIGVARSHVEDAARGDGGAIATLEHVVREYCSLSRSHLDEEERSVFPFAERCLEGKGLEELEAALAADEAARGEGWLEDLVRRQERLEELS